MKTTLVGQIAWDLAGILLVALGVRHLPEATGGVGGASSEAGVPEVAVVMGAQVLSGGRASRTLRARTLHAADLYRRGVVKTVVVTGGLGEHGPPEADVMARILAEAGVPELDIVREDGALNSHDSAVNVSRMMREAGVERVLVVTDPLHCVRTVPAFEEFGLRAVAEPVYSSPMWRVASLRLGQMLREMGASVWYRTHHGVGLRSRRW